MVKALPMHGVCGIYGAIHRDSGRVYVGSSANIGRRFISHMHHARGNRGGKFYNALRKYGFEAFDFEVLEECAQGDLQERERFYIQFMDSVANGFNLAAFPEKSRFGVKATAETCAKVSAALRGKKRGPVSPEGLAHIRAAVARRVFTPEQRANLSARFKGKKMPKEHGEKISRAQIGRVASAETRAKFSAIHKGKVISQAHRDAISSALKGRTVSEETRAKLRAVSKIKPNMQARSAEACSVAIFQIEKTTGEIIAEHASISNAAKALKMKSHNSISQVLSGKAKSAYGFKWTYKNGGLL